MRTISRPDGPVYGPRAPTERRTGQIGSPGWLACLPLAGASPTVAFGQSWPSDLSADPCLCSETEFLQNSGPPSWTAVFAASPETPAAHQIRLWN